MRLRFVIIFDASGILSIGNDSEKVQDQSKIPKIKQKINTLLKKQFTENIEIRKLLN